MTTLAHRGSATAFIRMCRSCCKCCVLGAMFAGVGSAQEPQAPVAVATPSAWVDQHLNALVETYRHLHANPELSFHEEQTARFVAQKWRELGFQVTEQVGGFGVVAILENTGAPSAPSGDGQGGQARSDAAPVTTLMLRCDMDALPVTEATNLVYSSQVRTTNDTGVEVGVMHACGHDIHMTCAIGTAQYLAAHRDQWRGRLILIAQPAEERGAGAKAMLDDGLFERFPKPDHALALHVAHSLPAGKVSYRGGFAMANVDSVDITMKGRGGHGAQPHATIDPIVQASQLVMALQTIVSREVKPTEPAVITVGSIHGGTKHNIIGDDCHLQITVRSYKEEVRQLLLEAIQRKAKAIAVGARAEEPEITISEGTPSLFNDSKLVNRLLPVMQSAIGVENVVPGEPTMGGEDFSRYGRAGVPIFMFRLGSVEAKRLERFATIGIEPPSLHSAEYYPDAELTLRTGIVIMSTATLRLLPP